METCSVSFGPRTCNIEKAFDKHWLMSQEMVTDLKNKEMQPKRVKHEKSALCVAISKFIPLKRTVSVAC